MPVKALWQEIGNYLTKIQNDSGNKTLNVVNHAFLFHVTSTVRFLFNH